MSKEKEAELENALQELTHSQGQMGQQQSRTHQQQLATLASMQVVCVHMLNHCDGRAMLIF